MSHGISSDMTMGRTTDMTARGYGRRRRARAGSAVFMVLIMTMALAALATSALMLTSGGRLVAQYHEQERGLRYAAEAALQAGISDLNQNPFVLPDTGYVQIASNARLFAADSSAISNEVFDLYAGPTGAASKQHGRFVTVIAIAKDTMRNRQFIRRVELNQESFAKFAYFSVTENGICFGSNDRINGPLFTDDNLAVCSSPQKADFMDSVWSGGTVGPLPIPAQDTFYKGYKTNQKPISLPSTATLNRLYGLASVGGTEFFSPNTATDSTSIIKSRLEYAAYDLNADNDSTDDFEGYVRYYVTQPRTKSLNRTGLTNAQKDSIAIGYTRAGITRLWDGNNCGDWHWVKDDAGNGEWEFFPYAAHFRPWFQQLYAANAATADPRWVTEMSAAYHGGTSGFANWVTFLSIPQNALPAPQYRCYPGGDPHLAATERDSINFPTLMRAGVNAARRYNERGGTDTTYTDSTHSAMGYWATNPNAGANPYFTAALKNTHRDWPYLFPISKTLNPNFKGVIAVHGTVGVSGTVQGHITMYSDGSVAILDNLRLSNPADTSCQHLMGIVAGNYILPADNGVNVPQGTDVTRYQMRGGSSDLFVQSTVMALTSWGVEGLVADPVPPGPMPWFLPLQQACNGQNYARGCLWVQGSIIQDARHGVNGGNGTTTGYGYAKRYQYDNCEVQNPLPYFPTTGRFTVNNYYESDPSHFSVAALYRALTP